MSDGLLTTIDDSHAPAISSVVATSCKWVDRYKSLNADPGGQLRSSPVKHSLALLLSPVTRAVFSAERQNLCTTQQDARGAWTGLLGKFAYLSLAMQACITKFDSEHAGDLDLPLWGSDVADYRGNCNN